MRRAWTGVICTTILGLGIWLGNVIPTDAAETSTAGSADDPVVTKSYVDKKIAELTGGSVSTPATSASSSQTQVVTVPFGKKLIVAEGGEMIVRNGKAIVYSNTVDGLSDLTDGVDLAPNKSVQNNHLLLSARAERGLEPNPAQKNGLIVVVRGTYQLQ